MAEIETILYILLVVAGFSFIIAIHEAGHFMAAKRAGIECPVFSVGFPLPGVLRLPERFRNIFTFHWKGTAYRLGWIPFGGFVQMKGQEDSPTDVDENAGEQDDFRNVSYGNKVLVILGGVIMNAITGIIFFILAFAVFGVTFIEPTVGALVPIDAVTGEVTELWQSGKVQPGDRIIACEGDPVTDYEDAAYKAFFDDDGIISCTFLRPSTGEEFTIDVPLSYIHARVDAKLPPIRMPAQVLVGVEEAERSDGQLMRRDEIVAVNGTKVFTSSDLQGAFQDLEKGQDATLTVKREGQEIEVKATPRMTPFGHDDSLFGITLIEELHILGVQDGGGASKAGLLAGDQITAIKLGEAEAEGAAILKDGWFDALSHAALADAVNNAGIDKKPLRIRIKRGDKMEELDVTPQLRGNAKNRFALGVVFDNEKRTMSVLNSETLVVGSVAADSLAYRAGIRAGDEITDLPDAEKTAETGGFAGMGTDTVDLTLYKRLSFAYASQLKVALEGETSEFSTTKIQVKRGAEEMTFELTPTLEDPAARGLFAFEERVKRTDAITYGFGESIGVGLHQTNKNMMKILRTLKGLFTGKVSPTQLAGPVMIAKASYDLTQYGFGTLLFFLGFISINLAVVNVLPIPVLDGGLLVIVTLEKIKGGPLNEKVMGMVNLASFLLVIGLMLFVVFNDIRNLTMF